MILSIPYFPSLTDYKTLANDLRKRGQLLNHSLVVICHPDDEAEAYAFGQDISDLFLRSATVALPPSDRPKFGLSNDFFRAAVRYVESYKPQSGELADPALLYFDPAYRPTKNTWLDSLQADYYLKNAPMIFGNSKADEENARIFNGPLIISKTFYKASGLINYIPHEAHWRKYLKWELTKNSVETELIGTRPDSVLRIPATRAK